MDCENKVVTDYEYRKQEDLIMNTRIISYVLIAIFFITTAGFGFAHASNVANLRNELDRVQQNISGAQQALAEGQAEYASLTEQIEALEEQVRQAQIEIDAIRADIEETRQRIAVVQAEIEELEIAMQEQTDALNARLRAMYMNGNIRMLDVLLGSDSITSFLTNVSRVQMLHESDVAIIESLEAQHNIIQAHKDYLAGLEASLVADRDREASRQAALLQTQEQVVALRYEVAEQNRHISEMLAAQAREAERISADIVRNLSAGDFIGGDMLWPVPGFRGVSSEFGYRTHPILRERRMHTGIDIPAPTGTYVVAANGGTVMRSGWNNSFGNMIIIDHGGGVTTLYAHHSENLVRAGDVVGQGQRIARVGSTGMSTGPHLHFEVRINGQLQNPRNFF